MAFKLTRRFTLHTLLVSVALFAILFAAWIRYSKCNEPEIKAQIDAWTGWIADMEAKYQTFRTQEKEAQRDGRKQAMAESRSRAGIMQQRLSRARASLKQQEDLCRSKRIARWNPFATRAAD